MGADRVDIVRSSFRPTNPLLNDSVLQGDALTGTNDRLNIIKTYLGANTKVVLNSDHPSVLSSIQISDTLERVQPEVERKVSVERRCVFGKPLFQTVSVSNWEAVPDGFLFFDEGRTSWTVWVNTVSNGWADSICRDLKGRINLVAGRFERVDLSGLGWIHSGAAGVSSGGNDSGSGFD